MPTQAQVIRKNNPTVGDVHISGPLTTLSVAYKQTAAEFVASRMFPGVGVQKQSDKYYKWNKDTFLGAFAKPRAPATESAGGTMAFGTDSYSCDVFAFHYDLDDQVAANADSQLTLEQSATELVMGSMLREKERAFMADFFKTGVWATDVVGKSSNPTTGEFLQWDQASSTPRKNVELGVTTILKSTGQKANTLLLGREVYAALLTNAEIKDQFKYTSSESINAAMIARYFGVDRVLTADAVYYTGSAYAFLGGKNALLCYVNPTPSLNSISAGYTFEWSGYTGAVGGVRMSRLRADLIKSWRIEGEYSYDMKLVANDVGYFFSAAVA